MYNDIKSSSRNYYTQPQSWRRGSVCGNHEWVFNFVVVLLLFIFSSLFADAGGIQKSFTVDDMIDGSSVWICVYMYTTSAIAFRWPSQIIRNRRERMEPGIYTWDINGDTDGFYGTWMKNVQLNRCKNV